LQDRACVEGMLWQADLLVTARGAVLRFVLGKGGQMVIG